MNIHHSLLSEPRSSGILLHPTSLPGSEGIGTLGPESRRFLDFLASAGQRLWQMLPVGPTGYGDSPYQGFSAFAGNALLISLEDLARDGLIEADDLNGPDGGPGNEVDFRSVIPWKRKVLHEAFVRFQRGAPPGLKTELAEFRQSQPWLEQYSLFMTLKEIHGGVSWLEWEPEYRHREANSLARVKRSHRETADYHVFVQWLFHSQWSALREAAGARNVSLIGDMPIFVSLDSADVWANRRLFQLDESGHPVVVAGVPPDYYSATGQLWGNPIYDWDSLAREDFLWWRTVLESRFTLFDFVRVDHFRGFAGYWAVPSSETTAENGEWVPGPGAALFESLERQLGRLPIIAEDLGVITPDVVALKEQFRFPGMKILQFGFDTAEANNHLPHTYTANSIVHTGSHDNDTTLGWLASAKESDRAFAMAYLDSNGNEPHWDFIRAAMMSVCQFAVIPMQDLLGLASDARMNTPGTLGRNWTWRIARDDYARVAPRLAALTELYSRAP